MKRPCKTLTNGEMHIHVSSPAGSSGAAIRTKIKWMKSFFIALFACALFACNNEGTDSTTTDTTIEQDNTMNRDTGMMSDTGMNRTDTARKDSVR